MAAVTNWAAIRITAVKVAREAAARIRAPWVAMETLSDTEAEQVRLIARVEDLARRVWALEAKVGATPPADPAGRSAAMPPPRL